MDRSDEFSLGRRMGDIVLSEARTVLITGATGSVGGGAAVALARRGVRVVLLGRNQDRLEARAKSFRAALSSASNSSRAGDIATLAIDLSDMDSVRHVAAEASDRYPLIHGLVLSAVVYAQGGPTILTSGHELMFATNVMGPFLLTQLLVETIARSNGLVLHVVAPFYAEVDWGDLESLRHHKTGVAYDRTKTYGRALAAELARRYRGRITSLAFDPGFISDKSDPYLRERWPSGPTGLFWRVLATLFAKPPAVAGEPIADLMLGIQDRSTMNGALFKLRRKVDKPDKAMRDEALGARLWDELVRRTGL